MNRTILFLLLREAFSNYTWSAPLIGLALRRLFPTGAYSGIEDDVTPQVSGARWIITILEEILDSLQASSALFSKLISSSQCRPK